MKKEFSSLLIKVGIVGFMACNSSKSLAQKFDVAVTEKVEMKSMTAKDANTTVRNAVREADETTPARSWDGELLVSVQLNEKDNIVVFNIQNVRLLKPTENEISEDKIAELGKWYLANFMMGYDYAINEEGVEGDGKMYKRVGTLLKLIAENSIGVRLKLDSRNDRTLLIDMSSCEVKEAIKMRKNDFFRNKSK